MITLRRLLGVQTAVKEQSRSKHMNSAQSVRTDVLPNLSENRIRTVFRVAFKVSAYRDPPCVH